MSLLTLSIAHVDWKTVGQVFRDLALVIILGGVLYVLTTDHTHLLRAIADSEARQEVKLDALIRSYDRKP